MKDVKVGSEIEPKKGIIMICSKPTGGCSQCDIGFGSKYCREYACCPEERKDNKHVIFKRKKCRVCGCTDDKACVGGCYWVEDDLCSQCKKN